jgi:membrane-associated protease RseP (regulator of RpoE activity)
MLEKYFSHNHESSNSQIRNFLLNRVTPLLLLILTTYTTVIIGGYWAQNKQEISTSNWASVPYALAILIIIGTHAFGHYALSRLHGVKVYTPYFIPAFGFIGTAGAYTKICWPITDRNVLVKIFIAGPITSFVVSLIVLLIGLFYSDIKDHAVIDNQVILGNSIIMHVTSIAIFGSLTDTKNLVLHPVAYAGWIGLFYNCCHLLPIGKLDGGRLIYALWGYRVTKLVSYVSIGILFILGYFLSDWTVYLGIAIWGSICTIGFRKQYPSDQYDQPLEKSLLILMGIVIIIFVISFTPTPLIIG